MDRRLKQRLIGALVLVSVGVIFIPMILDGPGTEPVIEKTNIPPRPEGGFASRVTPLPPQPALPAAVEPSEPAPAPPREAVVSPSQAMSVPNLPAPEPAGASVPEPPAVSTEEPQVPAEAPPAPRPPPAAAKPKPPEPAPVAAVSKPRATPSAPPKPVPVVEPPTPSPAPMPGAAPARSGAAGWAVQMGSFSSNENAIVLRDRLRANGFAAFVEPAYGRNDQLVRVFVGPQLQRADAEAVAAKLRSALALKGIVVSYP